MTETEPRSRSVRTFGRAVLLLAVLAIPSCNEQIRARLQREIDAYWSQPAKRAELDAKLEAVLETKIEDRLEGRELEVPGPNPYLHALRSLSVGIGSVAPRVSIPGTVEITQTGSNYYAFFRWKLDWPKGNGARVDLDLDLRSDDWFLFYEYPDHTVRIRDLALAGTGTAVVVVPAKGGRGTASITISSASLDLTAAAEGWFWTVDVSGEIKKQLREQLLRQSIGKAIEAAFDATLANL